MASPNASAAMLRQSSTYSTIPDTYRAAWLDACLKLDSCDAPKHGEVFTYALGEQVSHLVRDRLNDYGLAAGIEFVIGLHSKGASFEVRCKHYGGESANTHRLKDKVVVRDREGTITSDRVRNRDDGRTGCRVRYLVNNSSKDDGKGNVFRRWIGCWGHDYTDHSGHPFPNNPMRYLPLKRRLEEYQQIEVLSRQLRYSHVPYKKAREIFLSRGFGTIIKERQYYNIGTRLVKDIAVEDTPGALIAVFEEAGWLRPKLDTESPIGWKWPR